MKTTTSIIAQLILAGAVVSGFSSCKKDSINQPVEEHSKSNITVANGMLNFTSQKEFDNLLNELENVSLKDVDQKLSVYQFNSLKKDTINEGLVTNVKSPVLRRLLNNNGAIKIGETIYVIRGNQEFVVKNGDINSYNDIVEKNNYSSTDANKVEVHSIAKINPEINVEQSEGKLSLSAKMGASNKVPSPIFTENLFAGNSTFLSETYYNGRDERVLGDVWSEYYTFTSSCGVYLKGQAYRKGGVFGSKKWYDDEMYYSKISGDYYVTLQGIFTGSFDTGPQYGIAECRKTFNQVSGLIQPYINVMHANYEWRKAPQNPMGYHYIQI